MVFEESVELAEPFEQALVRVKESLSEAGFGVLTEIDVQATLRAKLGKVMERYIILGACNPTLADRALGVEPQIGVLLPCNVVLREVAAGVVVEALDPGVMAELVGDQALRPIADEGRRLLGEAFARLGSSRD